MLARGLRYMFGRAVLQPSSRRSASARRGPLRRITTVPRRPSSYSEAAFSTSNIEAIRRLLYPVQQSTEKLAEVRFCSGTYNLTNDVGSIAYLRKPSGIQTKVETGWIDFTSPDLSDAEFKQLADACDVATFGRGDEGVLDPSYRRALKLDASKFVAQFDLAQSGLLRTVQGELLRFNDNSVTLEAELYKLNVYGPGSHFKSHVDTPRSDKMFGSLVVVFPTEHVGGDLILRDEFGRERTTFESSKIVSKTNQGNITSPPRLAWLAFYSDVPHEITPVESGYRITLTYNLYHAQDVANHRTPAICPPLPEASAFKSAMEGLLASPRVLPDGGALGFGLTHRYPISKNVDHAPSGGTSLSPVTKMLKGTDALVKRICTELGLECQVKGHYDLLGDLWPDPMDPPDPDDEEEIDEYRHYREHVKYNIYLTDKASGDGTKDDCLAMHFDQPHNFRVVDPLDYDDPDTSWDTPNVTAPEIEVLWVSPPSKLGAIETHVQGTEETYGNEPAVGWVYARLVLIARVPPFKIRRPDEGDS